MTRSAAFHSALKFQFGNIVFDRHFDGNFRRAYKVARFYAATYAFRVKTQSLTTIGLLL